MGQRWTLLLAGWCVFCFVLGCQPDAPSLITVHDISPADTEPMDRLRIRGEGFPEGRDARITLQGTIQRAGEARSSAVRVEVMGFSESADSVGFEFTDSLALELIGSRGEARHGTFKGRVDVAFAPLLRGAPPVSGGAAVLLDIYPSAADRVEVNLPTPLPDFFGAELTQVARGRGLLINTLVEEGRLAKAGLVVGDILVQTGQLHIKSLADLQPAPGQLTMPLRVRRHGLKELQSLALDVEGFAPQRAALWTWGLALLVALCAALVLTRTSAMRGFMFLATRTRLPQLAPEPIAIPGRRKALRPSSHGLGTFFAVSSLFAAIGARAVPWAADFDLFVIFVCGLAMAMLGQLVGGGAKSRSWSLFGGVASVVKGLVVHVTVFLCLLTVVLESGELALVDLALRPGQGHALGLFQSPSMFVAGLTLTVCIAVQSFGLEIRALPQRPLLSAMCQALHMGHLLTLCGLVVALFFGGFGVPLWLTDSAPVWAGPLGFQAKLVGLYLGAVGLARLLQAPACYVQRTYWRQLLPAAALAALVTPIWLASAWPEWLKSSLLLSLSALAAVGALVCVLSLLHLARSKRGVMTVNPWL